MLHNHPQIASASDEPSGYSPVSKALKANREAGVPLSNTRLPSGGYLYNDLYLRINKGIDPTNVRQHYGITQQEMEEVMEGTNPGPDTLPAPPAEDGLEPEVTIAVDEYVSANRRPVVEEWVTTEFPNVGADEARHLAAVGSLQRIADLKERARAFDAYSTDMESDGDWRSMVTWQGIWLEGYQCNQCHEVFDEDMSDSPIYECGQCTTRYNREGSADGDSNRCPDCNKFGAKVHERACPECGEGELEVCRLITLLSLNEPILDDEYFNETVAKEEVHEHVVELVREAERPAWVTYVADPVSVDTPAKVSPSTSPQRTRTPALPDDHIIRVHTKENPKRASSKAHASFALFRDGMTVKEYEAAGGKRSDVKDDAKRGHVSVEPPTA